MAPALQSSLDTAKRATSAARPGPNILAIVCGVVGGVLLVAVIAVVFFVLRRRRGHKDLGNDSKLKQQTLRHKHTHSDAIDTPLLHVRPNWFSVDEDSKQDNLYRLPSNRMHERTALNDSLDIEKHFGERISFASPTDATLYIMDHQPSPSKSSPRDLPRLTIPPSPTSPAANTSTIPFPTSPTKLLSGPRRDSSICSESSVSEYSQASAMSDSIATTARPPPLSPMLEYIATSPQGDSRAPARSDTVVISQLLKERAKRNPEKIARGVSRIERRGSIKPALSLNDVEETESFRLRLARAKAREPQFIPMANMDEVPASAVSSDHSPLSAMIRDLLPDSSVAPVIPSPIVQTDLLPVKAAPLPSQHPPQLVPSMTSWTVEGPASAVSSDLSTPSTIGTQHRITPGFPFPPAALPPTPAFMLRTEHIAAASPQTRQQHVSPLVVPQRPLTPQNLRSLLRSSNSNRTIRGLVPEIPTQPIPPPSTLRTEIITDKLTSPLQSCKQEAQHVESAGPYLSEMKYASSGLRPTATPQCSWLTEIRVRDAEAVRIPDMNRGTQSVMSLHGHISGLSAG